MLVAHLVLTGLPGIAAALFAARRGLTSVPVLLAIAPRRQRDRGDARLLGLLRRAGAGGIALLLRPPRLGRASSPGPSTAAGSSVACCGQLATPLALWALGSAFLVFLGFLHGGTDQPLGMAMTRFSAPAAHRQRDPLLLRRMVLRPRPRGTAAALRRRLAGQRPAAAADRVPAGAASARLARRRAAVPGAWRGPAAALDRRALGAAAGRPGRAPDPGAGDDHGAGQRRRDRQRLLRLAEDAARGDAAGRGGAGDDSALGAGAPQPLGGGAGRGAVGAGNARARLQRLRDRAADPVRGLARRCRAGAGSASPSRSGWSAGALVGLPALRRTAGEPPDQVAARRGDRHRRPRRRSRRLLDSYREAGLGGTIHNKAENFVDHAPAAGRWRNTSTRPSDAARDGDFELVVEDFRNIFFFNLLPSLGLLLFVPLAMVAARRRGRDASGRMELRADLLRGLRDRRRCLGTAALRQLAPPAP